MTTKRVGKTGKRDTRLGSDCQHDRKIQDKKSPPGFFGPGYYSVVSKYGLSSDKTKQVKNE